MQHVKIARIFADPQKHIGKNVEVKGWVRTRRGNKQVQFVALNDGSSINNLQIVFDMSKFTDDEMKQITTGASIRVTGSLVESMGKGQVCEVQAAEFEVYGTADPLTYPLQKKGHTLEFLREKAHLRPRTNTFGAVLRVLLPWPSQYINSSTRKVSSIFIPPLSLPATAREPAQCSRLQLCH